MIQKLIILGVLKKKPSSGYDIKKFIQKELGVFSQPETKSIYYPLKKMEKEGLIEKREERDHLKKYVYYITPRGEKEFFRLCKETLLSQKRPFLEWDIALYFLPFLDEKEILPLLRLRLLFLEKVKKWLEKKLEEFKEAPPNFFLLVNHHLQLVLAEKDFLRSLIRAIKKDNFS